MTTTTTEQANQLVRACRFHADFAINRYLMSNADGRESGAEKAQRHHELCEFYVDVFRGEDDEDQNWYWAAHTATQQLTDNLDTEIGFPLKGAPDYDKLVPLFFERFHALASAALTTPPAASPASDAPIEAYRTAYTRYEAAIQALVEATKLAFPIGTRVMSQQRHNVIVEGDVAMICDNYDYGSVHVRNIRTGKTHRAYPFSKHIYFDVVAASTGGESK